MQGASASSDDPGAAGGHGGGEVIELAREECLELLGSHSFGRLAVNMRGAAPVLRPVNYRFDAPSQSVVFRTGRGSKLHALLQSGEATFEIDWIDSERRCGWSVIIVGAVAEITRPAEIARLGRLGLDRWMPDPDGHWIQIRARTVSGRRVIAPAASVPASAAPAPPPPEPTAP